jgi:nitrite reductase/ring-hydroxylating ferredoxin subunit
MSNSGVTEAARAADTELQSLVSQALQGASERLEEGRTLPPAAYTSQAFFDLEVERLFRREWLCLGHVAQIPNPGDYFTFELLGEPLLIVRGKDRIRVLSNVCRHRWATIADGAGNAPGFSCPFHKWTYALDGSLIGAPLMEQAHGFDRKSCRLPEFRSEVVEDLGLIFVTFAQDIPPVTERLASLCERVRSAGWSMKDQVVVNTVRQETHYNWKVQVETYGECYHHIGAHLESLQRLLPAAATACEDDKGSWTVCNVKLTNDVASLSEAERKAFDSFAPGAQGGETIGRIVIAYPFTLMTFMHGGCDIRILNPVSPSLTRSIILATRERSQVAEPGFDRWLEEFNKTAELVNEEDNAINDRQQRGVASAYATEGRFSHLEACAWHLAQYVRRGLRGG